MRTRVAVIENEFGEVGIDDELLAKNTKVQAEEELIEMMNGCICCTVRQDLVVVLQKVHARAMHASARACECTRVRCTCVHVRASARTLAHVREMRVRARAPPPPCGLVPLSQFRDLGSCLVDS